MGVIARRGVRVAAAEVDIYIMTLFEAGSETDSAETLSCPHSTAHGWLQRGDMGRDPILSDKGDDHGTEAHRGRTEEGRIHLRHHCRQAQENS